MIKIFVWIFLLSLWHSFLFYKKSLGISVLLFIIPLLTLIIISLKNNNKIKNKWGLLLGIPIIILSSTYLFRDNQLFGYINLIIIPSLFIIMYIMTMKPTFYIPALIQDFFSLIIEPLTCIKNVEKIIEVNISKKVKLSNKGLKKIKSFILILPILFIIIWLLTSADMMFGNMIVGIFNEFQKFINNYINYNILGRIIIIIAIFIYISITLYYIILDYLDEPRIEKLEEVKTEKDQDTIKILFVVLIIIYVIFDSIQIKSLIFHSVSHNINYAEYARQGFFQLMIVSIINISLLLFSKQYYNKLDDKKNKFLKITSLMIILLTLIIIISSFLRMNLYESQYGYTLLRLLVYITLITESILLIPTLLFIIKKDYNIVKSYMIVVISVYVIINFINIDYLIATRNIKRYYDKKDIDLEYLENNHTDNLEILVKFSERVEDKEIKKSLKEYFKKIQISMKGIQEYNLSKSKGIRAIHKYK